MRINFKKETMKCAILASMLATAAAFAPAKNSAQTSVVAKMAFEDEVGATPPLGFYDPLGLVASGDQKKFDRLREVEVKHGRISMLAVVGYIYTYAGARFPGAINLDGDTFEDVRYGFAAFNDIKPLGIIQLVGFIGFLELNVMRDFTGEAEFPGDFRNGFVDYGWYKFDEETKIKKRNIELNQGRAAMMGILALMVHEQLGVNLLPESIDVY